MGSRLAWVDPSSRWLRHHVSGESSISVAVRRFNGDLWSERQLSLRRLYHCPSLRGLRSRHRGSHRGNNRRRLPVDPALRQRRASPWLRPGGAVHRAQHCARHRLYPFSSADPLRICRGRLKFSAGAAGLRPLQRRRSPAIQQWRSRRCMSSSRRRCLCVLGGFRQGPRHWPRRCRIRV